MWLTGLLATLAAAGAGVDSLPNLRLEIGSSALVSFDDEGKPRVVGEAAPSPAPGELDMLAQMLGRREEALGANSLLVSTDLYARPVANEQVRFSFVQIASSGDTLLIIRNGFRQSFAYKARIGIAGKAGMTDVCQVLPGLGSLEHWPYKIDWIEITAIHSAAWQEGDRPRCE